MLAPNFHGSFKRDRKLMEKRNKEMAELTKVMGLLISEQPLPQRSENHPLHGKYKGWWECHMETDWLLIYRVEKSNKRVVFYRTGSHSDLF